MNFLRLLARPSQFVAGESLQPDVMRAVRSAVGFIGPLLLLRSLGLPTAAALVATTAQNVALTDARGAYRTRVAVLLTMTLVMALATFLGMLTGGSLVAATLTIGALALLGGVWRHLSADYGPGLAITSVLLFLIAQQFPSAPADALRMGGMVVLGGCAGVVLQSGVWFFRPQHPLRHSVAESWVAVADLFAAMRPETNPDPAKRAALVVEAEEELRAVLDRTTAALDTAKTKRSARFVAHLDDLHMTAARFATRLVAFNFALESLAARPEARPLEPTIDSVLRALGNLGRSTAITVMTHRPEQLASSEARARRCGHLIQVLDERLAELGPDLEAKQLRTLLGQVASLLPALVETLRATVDRHAPRGGVALYLPDLSERSLRSLSSWLTPAPQVDPVLVRYAMRMAAMTMVALAVAKFWQIPHGFWIGLTVLVVLQPDYGSTRERAAQRIAGTVGGSLLASVFLWAHLPSAAVEALAALAAFGFGFFIRRGYARAVLCVTVMVILITEVSSGEADWKLTATRVGCTVGGGALAWLAALFFWPSWERARFPQVMAAALRANRRYLAAAAERVRTGAGGPFSGEILHAKRAAERASAEAGASLRRLLADPPEQRREPERATALVTYNARITHATAVLALHAEAGREHAAPEFASRVEALGLELERLATAISVEANEPAERSGAEASLTARQIASEDPGDPSYAPLQKIAAELGAMRVALRGAA